MIWEKYLFGEIQVTLVDFFKVSIGMQHGYMYLRSTVCISYHIAETDWRHRESELGGVVLS